MNKIALELRALWHLDETKCRSLISVYFWLKMFRYYILNVQYNEYSFNGLFDFMMFFYISLVLLDGNYGVVSFETYLQYTNSNARGQTIHLLKLRIWNEHVFCAYCNVNWCKVILLIASNVVAAIIGGQMIDSTRAESMYNSWTSRTILSRINWYCDCERASMVSRGW